MITAPSKSVNIAAFQRSCGLCGQIHIAPAMTTMIRPSTKVKICGITSVEDAVFAVDAGADAIGMVFYPPSPRHMSDLGLANEIAQEVGPFSQVVSLFVDEHRDVIENVLNVVSVNCIQFHGRESAADCELYSHPYMKAIRMKSGLNVVEEASRYSSARGILLDTYVKGVPGGTGEAFNWDRVPKTLPNVVLAGGLTHDNVQNAIQVASPYAVDVSGGVEHAPGKKDLTKVAAFIRSAKLEQTQ